MDPGSCATASLFMPIGPPERGSLTSDFEMTQSLQYAGSLTRQAFGVSYSKTDCFQMSLILSIEFTSCFSSSS